MYPVFFQVDLDYPRSLMDDHNGFPCCPEPTVVTFDMLSKIQQEDLIALRGEKAARKYKVTKLVASFKPKEKYVVHIQALATYLQLGLRLKKVWRCFSFVHDKFIKKYVE